MLSPSSSTALAGFNDEQERYRRRLADAEQRLASYRSRQGGEFAFSKELAEKRRQLAEVDEALATDIEGASNPAAIVA